MRWFAFALLVAAGCYSPSYVDCEYRCSTNKTCPDGLTCSAGACRTEHATGSCDVAGDDARATNDDADPDAMPPRKQFENATELVGVESYMQPTLTPDEHEMWLVKDAYIFHTTHQAAPNVFDMPSLVVPLSSPSAFNSGTPSITADGNTIYFTSNRNATYDVFHAIRMDSIHDFGIPSSDTGLMSNADERPGTIVTAGTDMIMTLGSGAASDLYETIHSQDTWLEPTPLDELNSVKEDSHPTMSGNGLTVVFASGRNGHDSDLYIATRPTLVDPFDHLEPIAELNSTYDEFDPWLSPNGHVIYFVRNKNGVVMIVRAETSP